MKHYLLILSAMLTITPSLTYSDPSPNNQAFHEILKQQGLDEKTRKTLEAFFNQHQLTLTKDEYGNPTIISKADEQGSYSIKVERSQPESTVTHYLEQDYSDRLTKLEQEIKQMQQLINEMSKQLSQLKSQ